MSIHYLVKLLCSKIDLISTLINTSCSLFVVRDELINRIIVFLDIEAIWLAYIPITLSFLNKFCWSLSFLRAVSTLTFYVFCASLLPPVRKCNNVRDLYELPDFRAPNNPDLNPVNHKIWGIESTRKKTQEVNDLRRHLIDVWVGVKHHYWRCHRLAAQTSPCLDSSHKRTIWIFTVI